LTAIGKYLLLQLPVLMTVLIFFGSPAYAWPHYYGSITFIFPSYSSVHDCVDYMSVDDNQGENSEACLSYFQAIQEMEKDGQLPDEYRHRYGIFGEQPLILRQANVEHCSEDGCRQLGDIRVGPPENMWRAPKVESRGDKLHYRVPSQAGSVPHKLLIEGVDGQVWRTDRFLTRWPNSYLLVRLDQNRPGHLLVAQDWYRTLSDKGNQQRLLDNMIEMILYWCGLMLLALFSLLSAQLIMRSFFQNLSWGKHESMLAIAGFGGSALLPLMLLSFDLLPSGIHQLTGLLLVYLATLPFDVWWLCRGRRMNLYAALLLACALKLGVALMLWLLVWLL